MNAAELAELARRGQRATEEVAKGLGVDHPPRAAGNPMAAGNQLQPGTHHVLEERPPVGAKDVVGGESEPEAAQVAHCIREATGMIGEVGRVDRAGGDPRQDVDAQLGESLRERRQESHLVGRAGSPTAHHHGQIAICPNHVPTPRSCLVSTTYSVLGSALWSPGGESQAPGPSASAPPFGLEGDGYTAPVSSHADQPPQLATPVPGPRSRALAVRLATVESRDTTCLAPEPPIFWERARGANVWDVDGNRFVDLSGAFGVACVGHAHPRVVEATARQAGELLHGMGDVHPAAVKVELLEALCRRFPGGGPARAVLGSSGSDAVEAALKTAQLASGRAGVVAFEGAYHGLSLGTLELCSRSDFRAPFAARLPAVTARARYGDADDVLRAAADCPQPVGALIVEPVQGRGGERVPPPGFLRRLRELCDERGWLLIADEVYTGFGRTGAWFACEHEQVVPDLLCVAKGLASGMPISACLGRAEVMDAWPASRGEALHTQTFLGHPPSCAAALASLAVIEEEKLVERSAELGRVALERLRQSLQGASQVREVRGLGLMLGVECVDPAAARRAVDEALARGVIALPSGEDGRVIGLSPPLTIDSGVLLAALDTLAGALA